MIRQKASRTDMLTKSSRQFIILFSTALLVGLPGICETPVNDKWALVIGISQFAHPEYNLRYAAKDATDFRNYLIGEAGFAADHVKLLTNQNATAQNIRRAFGDQWLPRLSARGDLVVVYISTHGTPATRDPGGKNYIVAYDTDRSDLYATGVAMDELCERIKTAVKSQRVLIVLDTCYSGGATANAKGGESPDNFDSNDLARRMGTGRLLVSSSAQNQRSWESKDQPNGVFTRYFINALRLNNNTMNVKEAFDKIKPKVEWEVQRDHNAEQSPQIAGDWEGEDLILSVKPVDPRPMGPIGPTGTEPIETPSTVSSVPLATATPARLSEPSNSPLTKVNPIAKKGTPSATQLTFLQGKQAYNSQNFQLSLQLFKEACSAEPMNPDYQVELALAELRLKDNASAIKSLNAALMMPHASKGMINRRLAWAYMDKWMWDEALLYCREAIKINPRDGYARLYEGFIAERRSDYDEAIRQYQSMIDDGVTLGGETFFRLGLTEKRLRARYPNWEQALTKASSMGYGGEDVVNPR